MSTVCLQIADQIGELFTCSEVNGSVRIRTPYLYPDGDYIDLFLKEKDGVLTLTDYGETLRWLKMQTPSLYRSKRQDAMIQDICLTHGVELYKGMLFVRSQLDSNLAEKVTQLAQSALRVSDLWFTQRTRAFESILDEVADLLKIKHIPFDERERYIGRSGRSHRIDFHTRHAKRSSLINVLSTGSRAAAKGRVDSVLASWHDLNHLKAGIEPIRFVSLFDDTLDVWTPDNIRILEDFSEVAYWSKPEEFTGLLVA